MKTITINLIALLLFGCLSSCGTDATDHTTTEVTEKNTIEKEEPEVIAKSKEEELQDWKSLIDNNSNASLDEENYEYTCDGWGGSLSFVNDQDKLRAIVYVNGGEDGSKTSKFYYNDKDELVLVWKELVLWAGDNNTTTQTTYYIENGQPFKVLIKEAKGTAETIKAELNKAKETVVGTADDFGDIEAEAGALAGLTGDQIQAHFCN